MLRSKRNLHVRPTNSIDPSKKNLKKECRLDLQKKAFSSLIRLRAANGGDLKHGDVVNVANEYFDVSLGDYVNKRVLFYRLGREKRGLPAFQDEVPVAFATVVDNVEVSTLTADVPIAYATLVDSTINEETTEVLAKEIKKMLDQKNMEDQR